jgi:hypothetical protein
MDFTVGNPNNSGGGLSENEDPIKQLVTDAEHQRCVI